MKRLIALFAVLALTLAARAEVETYNIDPTHSSAGFTLRHVLSNFSSSFTKVTGTITVDRENLEKSNVTASISVTALNTDSEKRDNHIKGPDFFDVAKFPAMTFKSTSWKKTGENTFDVTGDLTIKDVTKPVVLKTTLLGFGAGMGPGSFLSGWAATTTIKKSEFNMVASAPNVAAKGASRSCLKNAHAPSPKIKSARG